MVAKIQCRSNVKNNLTTNACLDGWGPAKKSVWIGHSVEVIKDHYLYLSDSDFAEVAEADLENQISPVHDHAKPTVNDGLWRIFPLERHFDLVPCFPACIGFFSVN